MVDSYLGLTPPTHTSQSKIVYLEAKSNKIKQTKPPTYACFISLGNSPSSRSSVSRECFVSSPSLFLDRQRDKVPFPLLGGRARPRELRVPQRNAPQGAGQNPP